ncbi:MotE family protein [Actinophytocola sediminis]
MAADLARKAELSKLARTLDTTPENMGFAAALDHHQLRRLRERVAAALYDEHRTAFQRVAAITRMLPMPVNVRIALRAFTPMLAARVAGEMAPERAADMADRMPVDYLARAAAHLDPRRAAPLISRMQPDRAAAVVLELVVRGEYITLGHLLDAATAWLVRDVATVISDEALLRIGFYAESDDQLTQTVKVLPPDRLRGIVHRALAGPPDLRSAALSMLARLTDTRLRERLAGYAAEADDQTLTTLLRTAVADGAIAEVRVAVAAMTEAARRRVLALPALAEYDQLSDLLRPMG